MCVGLGYSWVWPMEQRLLEAGARPLGEGVRQALHDLTHPPIHPPAQGGFAEEVEEGAEVGFARWRQGEESGGALLLAPSLPV